MPVMQVLWKKERKCINWVNIMTFVFTNFPTLDLSLRHHPTSYAEIWGRSKASSLRIFSFKYHAILKASIQFVLLRSVFVSGTHSAGRVEMVEWDQPETQKNPGNFRLIQGRLVSAPLVGDHLTLARLLGVQMLSLLGYQGCLSSRPHC